MKASRSLPAAGNGLRPSRIAFQILRTGLVLFCIAFIFFGGVVSEGLLSALHCQPHADYRVSSCPAPVNWLAQNISPFLSAQTILDYPFIFLHSFWALILLWLGVIAWARWAAMQPRKVATVAPAARPVATSPDQSAHHVLRISFWLLLTGLIAFCIALGTPFLGSYTAREILLQMGCSPGTFDPFTSPCTSAPGFWTPRLLPFLIPILGQFLSPIWLVWKFYDVLIAWLAVIGLVAALRRHVASRMAAASS
ncbi:hypothetical protein [Polaromonas sp.]|uniref:hypothetical protein n=1 Tax=Polaromonas sp. TaxID=1869339 RepID=UPI0032654615